MNHAKLAALAATAIIALSAAVPASGVAKATQTGKHTVTERVYIKQQPGKIFTGTLMPGWTFKVKRLSPSGKYAYGMAYGQVNRHGWVEADALKRKR